MSRLYEAGPSDGQGWRFRYVKSVIGCAGLSGAQRFSNSIMQKFDAFAPRVYFTNNLDTVHPEYELGPSRPRIPSLYNHEPDTVAGQNRMAIITGQQAPADHAAFWQDYFADVLAYPRPRLEACAMSGFWGTHRYLGTDGYASNLQALVNSFFASAPLLPFGVPWIVMASHFPQATGNAMRAGVAAIINAIPEAYRRRIRFMTGLTEGGHDTTDWVDIPSLTQFHLTLQAAGFGTGIYIRTFGDPNDATRLAEFAKVQEYFAAM